ncbi:MAG: hypothetical protein GZ091_10595 [Paludibacter sp.]|nr:hypothetical protein [Paludibacter sp.]
MEKNILTKFNIHELNNEDMINLNGGNVAQDVTWVIGYICKRTYFMGIVMYTQYSI